MIKQPKAKMVDTVTTKIAEKLVNTKYETNY